MTNMELIRERIRQKLPKNEELRQELGIQDIKGLAKVSDEKLEALISPKILGLLSLQQEDIED